MDFFKSGLKTVLGAPEPGHQPSGAETVERLVDRVNNSTLLEDRRDACRALKAMSRKYRVEVGAQGMETLKQVLELDRADNETINYALDTLNNIMSPSQFEEEEDNPHVPMNIGEQFTEMFIKDHHNIQLVLDLLDEYDFRVRLSAVQLLTSLLTNRPKDIQEIILVKPMGVSKMMDLLADTREVIRNETLLLLIKLTKGNANIQKIVAFENAFDRLFEILSSEGYSDGGIIVEDCLLLMLNLLKNNSSNINFFKEGSYIQRMLPMFNTPEESEDLGWSPQKVSNVHCMLQIVRTLVSPSNSAQIISSCQKIMKNVGLLEALCNILMASGVPADILTETINTVGEVVRGDITNQDYLGNVMAPSNPPRPAIVVLLMSMVNEKQPFSLRCAVLYCFQCYLYHNEMSQASLVQTLLPSSSDVSSLTSGQLLCGGLFSSDALSNWFAAAALLRALCDNPVQKEQLLRVLLATNIGSTPVTLLHQCTLLLQQTTKLQSKVALLMLLSQWMSYCPPAVSAFLKVPGGVGYLVNQTCSNEHDDNECLLQGLCAFLLAICIYFNDDSVENYSKDSLKQLLVKRIGMEMFVAKLSEVSKHELYNKASKHPQLRVKTSAEVLIDYEFTKLFKVLEGVLVQSLTSKQENGLPDSVDRTSPDNENLEQYKTLIRQQDGRLQELMGQVDQLIQQNQQLQSALNDSLSANSHLKDENTLLKAQVSASQSSPLSQTQPTSSNDDKIREYEVRIHKINSEYESRIHQLNKQYEARINLLNAELATARQTAQFAQEAEKLVKEELEQVKKDQDDLLELLADQDIKLNEYKMRLLSLGQLVDEDIVPPQPHPEEILAQIQAQAHLASQMQQSAELASQMQQSTEYPSQIQQSAEYPSQIQQSTQYPPQIQQSAEYPSQMPQPAEYPSQIQQPAEYPSQIQQSVEYPSQMQQPAEYPSKMQQSAQSISQIQLTGQYTTQIQSPPTSTHIQMMPQYPTEEQLTGQYPTHMQSPQQSSNIQLTGQYCSQPPSHPPTPSEIQLTAQPPSQMQHTTKSPTTNLSQMQHSAETSSPMQHSAETHSPMHYSAETSSQVQHSAETHSPMQHSAETHSPMQHSAETHSPMQQNYSQESLA